MQPAGSLRSRSLWHGEVRFPIERTELGGFLDVPENARGLVLFAHGSGSSRHSPRNQSVARVLQEAGIATLRFDLLTRREEEMDDATAHLRFDIPFLSSRLRAATQWAATHERTRGLPRGYFGASTGAAAALIAASDRDLAVRAVVSRGGRPDLAGAALAHVHAPTLLIVGGADDPVARLAATWFLEHL